MVLSLIFTFIGWVLLYITLKSSINKLSNFDLTTIEEIYKSLEYKIIIKSFRNGCFINYIDEKKIISNKAKCCNDMTHAF